jgi:hypothetical protein
MDPLPVDWSIELKRVEALTQPVDITAEVSAVDVASAAQEAVDRLGMAVQQVKSEVDTGVPGPTGATGSMLSAGGITALPAKTTPADNDLVLLEDSADSLKMKKTLWSSIKSTLKTYFDNLYQAILTLPLSTTNGGTGSTAAANAASGVVVLNGSSQLPAVSAALLTNIPVPSGSVVQVVNVETGAVATGTTQTPFDDTIPQISEGDEYMTLAITPKSASNKLKIDVVCQVGNASFAGRVVAALFQDSTAGALAAMPVYLASATDLKEIAFTHYMTAGTVSATTFKVRIGSDGITITFNGVSAGRLFGGSLASSITITEIKA